MSLAYIEKFIDNQIAPLGIKGGEYWFESVKVRVTAPVVDIELKNDIYILVGESIDLPYTASLEIQSSNNNLVTSKTEYENLEYRRFQLFQEYLSIKIANYGNTFEPFNLEFIKVVPKFKNHESKSDQHGSVNINDHSLDKLVDLVCKRLDHDYVSKSADDINKLADMVWDRLVALGNTEAIKIGQDGKSK
jgi:hypothetical protein